MLNIEKQIGYWKDGSLSDIETAQILIEKGKFKEGLFFCHLTIEKILKAHYVKVNKDIPPKTHNIFFLIEKTELSFDKNILDFLGILMKYQLQGRYPDYKPPILVKEQVENYLKKTKEQLKWMIRKL